MSRQITHLLQTPPTW